MQSKNEIIEYLYNIDAVRRYGMSRLRMFRPDEQEDLIQECWANIAGIPEERLLLLYNQNPETKENLTAYIRTFVLNQLSSTGQTRRLQDMFHESVHVEEETLDLVGTTARVEGETLSLTRRPCSGTPLCLG